MASGPCFSGDCGRDLLDEPCKPFIIGGFEEDRLLFSTAKEWAMLVLSRKKDESIVINNDITIVVVEIRGDKVRLGVEAPKDVPVHRREVFEAIARGEPVELPAVTASEETSEPTDQSAP